MLFKVPIPEKKMSTGGVLGTINQKRNVSLEKENTQSLDDEHRMC